MRFVYPQGKKKALTFSYDDGQNPDKRLAELLRSHGMKGTFHLNSGCMGPDRNKDLFIGAEEAGQVYAGHEIACHGVQHRDLTVITREQAVLEIGRDRRALEKLTGGLVQGMSYAFGSYNREIMDTMRSLGIKYARTVKDTQNFIPPSDFMAWHPTCHHNNHLLELADRFLRIPIPLFELPLMYVWGHSFEFKDSGNWSLIEAFVDKMQNREDIWYAANIEICTYIQAVRQQEFSADGMLMHNPAAVSVWVSRKDGLIEVKPGETVYMGEL